MVKDYQCPIVFLFEGIERCHERARIGAFVKRLTKGGNVVDEHHLSQIRHGCRFYSFQYVIGRMVPTHLRTKERGREIWGFITERQLAQRHLEVGVQDTLSVGCNIPCHLHGKDGLADTRLSEDDAQITFEDNIGIENYKGRKRLPFDQTVVHGCHMKATCIYRLFYLKLLK